MTGPAEDVRQAAERILADPAGYRPDRHALLSADGRRIVGDCCCRTGQAHPVRAGARYRVELVEPLRAWYWPPGRPSVRVGDGVRSWPDRGPEVTSGLGDYRLVPIGDDGRDTDREERKMTKNDDAPTTLEATVPGADRTVQTEPVPAGVIRIDPDHGWPGRKQPLEAHGEQHQAAAEQVWRVLSGTLAQGTLERLLILMLTDRAGYRVVRARAVPVDALVLEGVADAGVRELAEAERRLERDGLTPTLLAEAARRDPASMPISRGPKVFGYTLDALGRLPVEDAEALARSIDAAAQHPAYRDDPSARSLLITALAILRRQR